MNYLVVLLILSLLGCEDTPGMKEPHIVECTILGEEADCIDKDNNTTITVPADSLLGYISVSPEDYAKVRNHHDALHSGLNECRK